MRLLTDPVLRSRIAHLVRVAEPVDRAALAPLDAVLISHFHRDHFDLPSLRSLPRDAHLVVPTGAGGLAAQQDFRAVTELTPGDQVRIGSVTVTAVPALHDGRREPLGPSAGAIGYVVSGRSAVYFAGDTDLFDGMAAALVSSRRGPPPGLGLGPQSGRGAPGSHEGRPCARAAAAPHRHTGPLGNPVPRGTVPAAPENPEGAAAPLRGRGRQARRRMWKCAFSPRARARSSIGRRSRRVRAPDPGPGKAALRPGLPPVLAFRHVPLHRDPDRAVIGMVEHARRGARTRPPSRPFAGCGPRSVPSPPPPARRRSLAPAGRPRRARPPS